MDLNLIFSTVPSYWLNPLAPNQYLVISSAMKSFTVPKFTNPIPLGP